MAAAGRSEERFLCSICLEIFSEPVSTPCGHNFCKSCICQTWDKSNPCKCPLCNKSFDSRPELQVNTLFSEIIFQFKNQNEDNVQEQEQESKPGEVQCDVCSEPKLKAVKSCLACLSSFCESHLQPHLTESGLKKHQLTEPVDNLEDRLCPKHQRPLELFCVTDQSCICTMCALQEHKNHKYVSLEEACEQRRTSLPQSQAQSQQMVEQRKLKIQEIRNTLDKTEREAQGEKEQMERVSREIMESVQRSLDHHIEVMDQSQTKNKEHAQDLIQQLQQEVCELEKSSTEAQQLSLSTDPLHFLQRCPALPPAGLKDWRWERFQPQKFEGSAAQALSGLEKDLSGEISKLFSELFPRYQLKRVQRFAVNITLDPDTANPYLALSEDLKQVHHTDVWKKLPESHQRFNYCPYVLGKQSFSSGRFYFEVQVKGKTHWDLGVAQESINRKQKMTDPFRVRQWSLATTEKHSYTALNNGRIEMFFRDPPYKVGVFVDYEAGLVSFYNVNYAKLIYSITGCSFEGKLLPFFCPCLNYGGENSAPLIISDVHRK